jgi:hypothetical protein
VVAVVVRIVRLPLVLVVQAAVDQPVLTATVQPVTPIPVLVVAAVDQTLV